MTKLASKEPSMDEILSSIRQIIADDDAGGNRQGAADAQPSADLDALPLSADLIIADDDVAESPPPPEPAVTQPAPLRVQPAPSPSSGSAASDLNLPNFSPRGPSATLVPPASAAQSPPPVAPAPAVSPLPSFPPPPPFTAPPEVTLGAAASRIEEGLARGMAEQLIDSAAQLAVRQTFARLTSASTVGSVSLDDMLRDMLRPMLKEWLDQNLPAVVERLVEVEIARIARSR